MKKLYFLDEEEKNRILNLHESATKRQYLSEQATSPIIVTNNDNAYEYKLENGQYTFRGKPGTTYANKYPNWVVSKTPKGVAAIKNVIDTKGKQTTTDPSKVVTTTTTNTTPVNTVVNDPNSEVIKKTAEANSSTGIVANATPESKPATQNSQSTSNGTNFDDVDPNEFS